jgi:hypothetical protein
MDNMRYICFILGALLCVIALFLSTAVSIGPTLAGVGCFLGIAARIFQAHDYHR